MNNRIILLLLLWITVGTACRKTEYTNIEEPAYLRIFNNLDYNITVDNKEAPQPFLTFLMDPELDADGIPVAAKTTGDFLDKRAAWARPYPDAVNTTLFQTEYPGSAKVLAGPVLNGYDLSSWAQIPSGKHRVMFVSRPISQVPFFQLPKDLRRQVIIDTVVDFASREVYTMHVLEKDWDTKTPDVYVRKETFIHQPFSDSLVYVNFYNLSAAGFFERGKVRSTADINNRKIRDTMNVYYSLSNVSEQNQQTPVAGHTGVLMGAVIRAHDPVVRPYYSFPLFPDTSANKIYTGRGAQTFTFLSSAYTYENNPFLQHMTESNGRFTELRVGPDKFTGFVAFPMVADFLTGMVVTIRSGKYLNRSFATVNTVEYVNGKFYLMTIQRKYEPPVY
ncbi:hypothetical protein SAMN04488128_101955 [Chitinophaga eiseniae]|uniref:Uncharacterized protein n=1 Tax=Chitinophaga eiseniae TaxID=634771 RepID=A0A1T4M6J1_9BACT|nr:hypothetical protein [Chitinophaga eiseniae]SJZ62344.1 hypothetical protein SAMN04488128_101955 [Chitinophaga eiseniae]